MYLIDQNGTRPICGWCHKPKARGEYAKPHNRKDKRWVCFDCCDKVLHEALEENRRAFEQNPDADYFLLPLYFFPYESRRFSEELRVSLIALRADYGKRLAVVS